MSIRRPVLACFAAFLLAPPLQAQPGPETKLTPSDPHEDQSFGFAVAIGGGVAVVGAVHDDPDFGVAEYGAAYVFGYDGDDWVEVAKLRAPQPGGFDWFGWSVALARMDEDVWGVFAGVPNEDLVAQNAGAVEYARCVGALPVALTCSMEATLSASDGAQGDRFGQALAVDGSDFIAWQNVLVVGAPLHDLAGADRGAAYVFRFDGADWIEEQKLVASDAGDFAYFGESVAMSGERILVGAWGDTRPGAGQNAGAAYVFEYQDGGEWVQTAKLVAPDAVAQAQFGISVALDGDRALIGAPLDNELGGGAGAAYRFHHDGTGWSEGTKILDAAGHTGFNLFGNAVALGGGIGLIGAENWFPAGGDATGRVIWNDSMAVQPIVASDAGAGDHFGAAVAVEDPEFPDPFLNTLMIVGAPDHKHAGGTGAAYIYGEGFATSVASRVQSGDIHLTLPFPNPFEQQTRVALTLTYAQPVVISVYDVLGRRVALLHDGLVPAVTPLDLTWNAGAAPPGLYFLRVVTPTLTATRRVVLQR